jgi:hypothetical protein
MTDLPDPLDELASAHLDGATTPEEAARIAADPALQARVQELRVARDALRAAAVAPVEAAQRNAAVAAALAAFHQADTTQPPATPVTSLAEVAARRRAPGLALRVLGAAAVLVLVALLVPLLAGQDDDAAETADRSGEELQETAGDAADGGSAPAQPEGDGSSEAAGGADAPATTGGAFFSLAAPLGSFDDVDALAAALTDDQTALRDDTSDVSALRCVDAPEAASNSRAAAVVAADATIAGEPVEVVVVTDADGARTMTVWRADTCALIATRDL